MPWPMRWRTTAARSWPTTPCSTSRNGRSASQTRASSSWQSCARRLDEILVERIGSLAATDAETARALRNEVVYMVRQRRRDLLMHLAVATQGRASLRRIEQGKHEVIRALRSASTTTLTALERPRSPYARSTTSAPARTPGQELLGSLDEVDQQRRRRCRTPGAAVAERPSRHFARRR